MCGNAGLLPGLGEGSEVTIFCRAAFIAFAVMVVRRALAASHCLSEIGHLEKELRQGVLHRTRNHHHGLNFRLPQRMRRTRAIDHFIVVLRQIIAIAAELIPISVGLIPASGFTLR